MKDNSSFGYPKEKTKKFKATDHLFFFLGSLPIKKVMKKSFVEDGDMDSFFYFYDL